MQRRRTAVQDAWTLPAMGYLTGYLALMAGIFLFLYWLLQPVRIVNAGQSVYIPPPQTRLIPLPRRMDAPELMETAETAPPSSPLAALAKAENAPAAPDGESGRHAKKRHRAETASREARRGYVVERSSAYYRSYDRYWQRSYRGW